MNRRRGREMVIFDQDKKDFKQKIRNIQKRWDMDLFPEFFL